MPTIFETLTDRFYVAFFESDVGKRRDAIEAWIKSATPIVQSAIENELRSYLDYVLAQTWSTEGWQSRAKKFSSTTQDPRRNHARTIPFIDGYKLRLALSIEHPWNSRAGEKIQIVDPVSTEAHAETLRIARQTLSQIEAAEAADRARQLEATSVVAKSLPKAQNAVEADDDYDNRGSDGGRSPNDDRSDSMNPNNDSYQASMDNRSDQMNPNNDAYWSSRGR